MGVGLARNSDLKMHSVLAWVAAGLGHCSFLDLDGLRDSLLELDSWDNSA